MAGRKRTVYFYTGAEIDDKGKFHEWKSTRWDKFFEKYTKPAKPYFLGRNFYEGEVDECSAPATRYFHLLRPRALSDWPEGKDAQGNAESLGVNRKALGLSEIDEYTYFLPVEDTNYVAMFRSSAGPRASAAGEWMTQYLDLPKSGGSFVFMPVLRTNAMEKLKSAVGVRSLHVRFEGQPHGESGSQIEKGVAVAGSEKGLAESGDMKIDFNITLGRAQKEGPAVDGLLKEAKRLVKGVNHGLPGARLSQLKAKTLQPGKGDKIVVEQVDFFQERMTVQTEFGDTNVVMDADQIIDGMYKAIEEFRKKSGEYLY
ncbi:hypothetical protein [Bifidobacterium polysaccharolyticum]|uniref:hypothetical protein n=1 Tax=Bifidobacterium polysaccharolyticum TaxID=2750967 RepID=UPI00061ACCFA|nr:Uncharacterized protein JF71_10180 [Bifidobacterium asteroides]